MNARNPRAFVLSAGHNGLGIVRSLAGHGIPITAVDCYASAPALFSRYCDHLVAPDPILEPECLVESLIAASRTCAGRPVLLPASDAYVLFVSRYRDVLAQHFRFAMPTADIVEAVLNKRLQYELADLVGTPYPPTRAVSEPGVGVQIAHDMPYPAFIKPIHSHLSKRAIKRKGVVVRTPDELAEGLAEILPWGVEVLVQSIVPGLDSDVYQVVAWLNAAHKPLGVFTFRKRRQFPPRFGVGTLVESVHDEQLACLGVKFLQGIGYQGFASVEFKRDSRDGQFKLIEMNARLPQQSSLATRCGLNLPLLGYLDLTDQDPAPQMCFTAGISWLDLSDDIRAAWEYKRRGELGIGQWLSQVVRARAFAYWDWRDPLPVVVAYASFCVRYLGKRQARADAPGTTPVSMPRVRRKAA